MFYDRVLVNKPSLPPSLPFLLSRKIPSFPSFQKALSHLPLPPSLPFSLPQVLHDGVVAEYDTPSALLNKGGEGLFYRMCVESLTLPSLRPSLPPSLPQVLHDGEVAEYDTPSALLNKGAEGLFYSMCEKTGDLEGLRVLAREKEEGGREGRSV